MSTVIKVENLSKMYRLGEVGTGTLSHDLNRWWHRMRGKEDPYLKIGESNDRSTKASSEYVYALKDINFEVKQGEVLGIIGKNGAGKSTLLKLLSRVTSPTSGSIRIKGRTASLLEVGTGFHPELTGRENIFLNGAILGMTKSEIRSKFDEIVDFSGVERYIDTPVKRYSSGMYVRLAFAVAAHLDPEILIVDEVLAVGDAEFQKRCLGKMDDISKNEGRTILFVSHNLSSILNLCPKSILINNGTIICEGRSHEVVEKYSLSSKDSKLSFNRENSFEQIIFIKSGDLSVEFDNVKISLLIQSETKMNISIDILFTDLIGNPVGFGSLGALNIKDLIELNFGENEVKIVVPLTNFAIGYYKISIDLTQPDVDYLDKITDLFIFEVLKPPSNGNRKVLDQSWGYGSIFIPLYLQN